MNGYENVISLNITLMLIYPHPRLIKMLKRKCEKRQQRKEKEQKIVKELTASIQERLRL